MSSRSVRQLSGSTTGKDDPVVMASGEDDLDQYQTWRAAATRLALIDNQLMRMTSTTAAKYLDHEEDDDEDHNEEDYYCHNYRKASSNFNNNNNTSYMALRLLEMKLGDAQVVQQQQHNSNSFHYYVQQQQQQQKQQQSESEYYYSESSSHDNYYCYNYNKQQQQQLWHKTLPQAEMLPRNEVLGGYIFVCNNETMQEDLHRQLFGT